MTTLIRDAADLDLEVPWQPSERASAGKRSLTQGLAPRSIVFRVASAAAARELGAAFGPRDRNGVAANADAAVDRAAGGGGAVLPAQLRDRFESSLGADLSSVRIHSGDASAEASAAVGARAYTIGNDIHFGAGHYQPDDPFGMHLIAHEVAHTQQQAGGPGHRQHKLEVSTPADAAEVEADRAADAMVAGRPISVSAASPSATVSRFSQEHHETATVDALHGTFSQEEVGAIYASNWERDFSQSVPEIANAVIAWQAVKNNMRETGNPGSAAGAFQDAASQLVNIDLLKFAKANASLGGYQPWEHLDKPDTKEKVVDADQRWAGQKSGLAGYILDAKAHIKDQMVLAIDAYKQRDNQQTVGGGIDNWAGGAKPAGYKTPNTVNNAVPPDWDDPKVESRDPIRDRTEHLAEQAGGFSDPGHDAGVWKVVGQYLGRSMHAFEDFWAHSNWLELAHAAKYEGAAADNAMLKTGDFLFPSQMHALGHKLVGFTSSLQADFDTVLAVYGRNAASTRLSRPRLPTKDDVKSGALDIGWRMLTNPGNPAGALGGWAADHAKDAADAGAATALYSELDANRPEVYSEAASTAAALGVGRGLVTPNPITPAPIYGVEDLVCNKDVLAAIRAKGEKLIKDGDAAAGADGHGQIAKDTHEGAKAHGGALAIATSANFEVFEPLRGIMDEGDPKTAIALLQTQLTLVDAMLQAPSSAHPLWHLV